MKKLLLTLLSFMVTFAVNAERVSKKEALQKAQQFMPGRHFVESKSVASARAQTSGMADAFYVFNAEDNGGYVIVSGDDRTREILSYADKGNLDMNMIPENMKWWLDNIASQIEALGTTLKPADKSATRSGMTAIAPLIETKWGQHEPYNFMCPDINGKDYDDVDYDRNNRCATGCVATALAQLLNYHKWPKECPALPSYSVGYYRNEEWIEKYRLKGLPSIQFKWNLMKNKYYDGIDENEALAIAELMRYCGQAVNMEYGSTSSAAIFTDVLINIFNYSKNTCLIGRSGYSASQWESIIYEELSQGRPVLYEGGSKSSGHQFIIDGYDGNGLFHINWGWNGFPDSYYVLSVCDPYDQGLGGCDIDSSEAFQYRQMAIIGMKPASEGEVLHPIFESSISSFEECYYTRQNGKNFENVKLFGAFNADGIPNSIYNIDIGWGIYQKDKLIQCISYENRNITFDDRGRLREGNGVQISFGEDLPEGKYELFQIYRWTGQDNWTRCFNPIFNSAFLIAEISGTTLLLKKQNTDNMLFSVDQITYSNYPQVGGNVDVIAKVTNIGESTSLSVSLWVRKEIEEKWIKVSTKNVYYDPGITGEVHFDFIAEKAGIYNIKITSDQNEDCLGNADINVADVEEIMVDNVKYLCAPSYKRAIVIQNKGGEGLEEINIQPTIITSSGTVCKVTAIADNAFIRWNKLRSIQIPEYVESIGKYAFAWCFNLRKVELPKSLVFVGEKAFISNQFTLEKVYSYSETPSILSDNVFVIRNEYSEYEPSTATLYVPKGSAKTYSKADYWKAFKEIVEIDGGDDELKDGDTFTAKTDEGVDMTFKVISASDKTCQVGTGAALGVSIDREYSGNITIPENVNGFRVTTVAFEAFGSSKINSVVIGNNVTSINQNAFSNCQRLNSVTFPDNSGFSLGFWPFQGCTSLETITLPKNLTSMDSNPFMGCSSLTYIGVDENNSNYKSVDGVVYSKDTKAIYAYPCGRQSTDYEIIEGTQVLGRAAFISASKLEKIHIPNSVSQIYAQAFWECTNLKALILPPDITYIPQNMAAFSGIKEVVIPNKVTSIESSAFSVCFNLTSVKVEIEEPLAIDENTFGNRANATLYVPMGSVDAYSKADYWRNFKKIMPIGDANGDGAINDADVKEAADFIMDRPSETFVEAAADMNGDGVVNVADIVLMNAIKEK